MEGGGPCTALIAQKGWSKMGEESRTTLRPSAGREMEGSVFSNDPLEMKQTQQVTQLGNW